MNRQGDVCEVGFQSYGASVPAILDRLKAGSVFSRQRTILLKPNLVNADPFPVTTSPDFCRAVIRYIKKYSGAPIIIAEGCGDHTRETADIFHILGYDTLAKETGAILLDLNNAPLVRKEDPANPVFPEMYLPGIAFDSFIFSLPVLKAHSLAGITGTLKNMMGFAPPSHYAGGGFWKKALFHHRIQASLKGLNRYLLPHFTLMDASVGLSRYHLGGPACDPPVNRLIAGYDAHLLDQAAAGLLELPSGGIPHINRF